MHLIQHVLNLLLPHFIPHFIAIAAVVANKTLGNLPLLTFMCGAVYCEQSMFLEFAFSKPAVVAVESCSLNKHNQHNQPRITVLMVLVQKCIYLLGSLGTSVNIFGHTVNRKQKQASQYCSSRKINVSNLLPSRNLKILKYIV